MQYESANIKCTKQGKIINIGDDLKGASSDALKKAASIFGLALDVYISSAHGKSGNGKSMSTSYLEKVYTVGLDRKAGQDIIKESGGDFDAANRVLEEQYVEQPA